MKKVAVVIDGGFVRITFQKYFRNNRVPTPEQIVKLGKNIVNSEDEELFRTYYYDCTPFEKELITPISRETFRDSEFIQAGKRYIRELSKKEKIAYRSGELKFGGWTLKSHKLHEIIENERSLQDGDFKPLFKQKRIDIKIGLDIAWLSIRKIVDRIILIAGDSDFIPAMKLARIEGVQITVAPLKNRLNPDMLEHADEIRDYDINELRST